MAREVEAAVSLGASPKSQVKLRKMWHGFDFDACCNRVLGSSRGLQLLVNHPNLEVLRGVHPLSAPIISFDAGLKMF